MKNLFLFLLIICSGCASLSYRPHTEAEKRMLIAAATFHAADAMTTSIAVGSGNFKESNRFYSDYNMEDNGGIISTKLTLIGGFYLIGQILPKYRMNMYKILAVSGAAPAAWNTGALIYYND